MDQTVHLKIKLFGGFSAQMARESVLTHQTTATRLVSYLALARDMSVSRAQLATFLWENSDEVSARRNLRQLLFRVRNELGKNWLGLISNSNTIQFDPSLVQTDAGELLCALDGGTIPQVLLETSAIQTSLLDADNFVGTFSESWLYMVRREFENQIQQKLEALLRGSDPVLAERAARAMLKIDAADETAACALIEHHWRQGDSGRAMRVYTNLKSYLDTEFSMQPGSVTEDLVKQIKFENPPVKETCASPSSAKMTIFVEPAIVASMPKDSSIHAELFRHEVITSLSNFRQFQIVDGTIQQGLIHNLLKLVFSGGSDSLRLVATLLDQDTGAVLWSETFSNVVDKWWQHQITIAGCLAAACAFSISASRMAQIEQQQATRTALDNWLLGQTLMLKFRPDSDRCAEKYFQNCIELSPNSSMGYSALSQLKNGQHLLGPGTPFTHDRIQQSKDLAISAISLDPRDTRAHLCRAWASCLLREYDQADASFSMARTLNPYDPWTVISSALAAAFMGQQSLAQQLSDSFFSNQWIPTRSHWGYLTSVWFLDGEYERAIEAAENSGDTIQNLLGWKAAAQWHAGRQVDARQSWAQFEASLAQAAEPGTDLSRESIVEWFLSAFPLSEDHHRRALSEGVREAAGHRHCVHT